MIKETLPVTGNLSKKCGWIERPASFNRDTGESVKAIYCGKQCKSYVTRDDDKNKVRYYEPFCPAHKYEAERLDNTTEDEI